MTASIALALAPREHDLGGFQVRRLLPAAQQRAVGPFIFFDEMGPATFAPGQGVDVRPHPHIGLATVTWLFEGALVHRDSLGFVQEIVPGDVNWMTAGRGIVHSERSPDAQRAAGHRLHGIQTWLALPAEQAEVEPAFHHHGSGSLPTLEVDDAEVTVIAGASFGARSPVAVFTDTLYAAVSLPAGGRLRVPDAHAERAVYAIDGELLVDGEAIPARHLAVLRPGVEVKLRSERGGRAILCGGAALDGPRRLWWNFVARDQARIDQASADWAAGRFAAVPGETEFIPLPER